MKTMKTTLAILTLCLMSASCAATRHDIQLEGGQVIKLQGGIKSSKDAYHGKNLDGDKVSISKKHVMSITKKKS